MLNLWISRAVELSGELHQLTCGRNMITDRDWILKRWKQVHGNTGDQANLCQVRKFQLDVSKRTYCRQADPNTDNLIGNDWITQLVIRVENGRGNSSRVAMCHWWFECNYADLIRAEQQLSKSTLGKVFYQLGGPVVRACALRLGGQGSIPGWTIPKTIKIVPDASLLGTQYKGSD